MEYLIAFLDAERGRRVQLAKLLGIEPQAISQWKRVPAAQVLSVEAITGISRHKLRPDIFGPVPPALQGRDNAA